MKLTEQYIITFKNRTGHIFYITKKLDGIDNMTILESTNSYISNELKYAKHFYSKRSAKNTWYKIKQLRGFTPEIKSIFST